MSSPGKWVIQLANGRDIRKVFRIWFGSDGSYYVTAPYHKGRSANLHIMTAYYERRVSSTSKDNQLEVGLLEDDESRLKLSHHPDGFCQFSGEGILSGRDEFGNPKGIGINSFRLENPPRTGPSFGCVVYGLSDFMEGDHSARDAVNFHEEQIPPLNVNGYGFEGSYFPASWREFVYLEDGEWFIEMRHNLSPLIKYRVLLSSTDSDAFIGIRVRRLRTTVGDAPSGFILSGPSTNVRMLDGERVADGIHCTFPALKGEDIVRNMKYVHSEDPEENASAH